jgi:hypothetical protein
MEMPEAPSATDRRDAFRAVPRIRRGTEKAQESHQRHGEAESSHQFRFKRRKSMERGAAGTPTGLYYGSDRFRGQTAPEQRVGWEFDAENGGVSPTARGIPFAP